MIKAIVFDSDGTLIDGFSTVVRAYGHVAALHGKQAPTAEEVREQLSLARPIYDIYRTFFPTEDVEQMIRENGEFIAANAANMPSYEGLRQMLDTLADSNFRMAILTGGNQMVHDVFRHHNLEHYFASIVHCDRVSRSKPDPEGFLLAAQECGVAPGEAVMVGDSPNDIFTGKNAGAGRTVAITHGNGSREALLASDPDYVVNNLQELEQLILTKFRPV